MSLKPNPLKAEGAPHVYIEYDCPHCKKQLGSAAHVRSHRCPGRIDPKLIEEELNAKQRVLDDSNNQLDEKRGLVPRPLKRTREEYEEGRGDDKRGGSDGSCVDHGVSKGKRGGCDDMCEESGDDEECEDPIPALPHSDNLRPEQMSPSRDQTVRENTVRQEVQCSSTYEKITATQQEPLLYGQHTLFNNGLSGGTSGGPTILISRNEAALSYNIDNVSHLLPWSSTEATTARAPYGNHTEGLEPQSNGWTPSAVQAPAPTNYLLVENDVGHAQAPALSNHPLDQYVGFGNLFGTQHSDKMATAHPLQLDCLDYGAQRHPP
ncbi:hypothetical protein FGADI_4550 [Fusarium gaditjirri]|uniref:Uncharacterized protein n=1 Tax=Fusarium gaditjirri TaxID=282569 RepID=A0A8H4TCH8_9HYPO|nr:hypothetical protein FGADI_4550 [Fusarium gaditjirri]